MLSFKIKDEAFVREIVWEMEGACLSRNQATSILKNIFAIRESISKNIHT